MHTIIPKNILVVSFVGICSLLLLVACGGGGGGDEVESGASSMNEGGNGGNGGGANGGSAGNGGGEGSGSFNIVFPPGAQCGVDFVAPLANTTGGNPASKKLEIYTPCDPVENRFFITNDGVVKAGAKECEAGARAIYQADFNVTNNDC